MALGRRLVWLRCKADSRLFPQTGEALDGNEGPLPAPTGRGPSLFYAIQASVYNRTTLMRSDTIKKGFERAPHRSLLRATGQIRSRDDFEKPFIAVCNSYVDIIPGHVHLQEFGRVVKEAIREAGRGPFWVDTLGVGDGIAM